MCPLRPTVKNHFGQDKELQEFRKPLMMIQALEPVVEYIQPASQVQYAQPQYVQQAPAVEQFSVAYLAWPELQEVKVLGSHLRRLPTGSCSRSK